MPSHISLVSLLVPDYDEAISWFTKNLGFDLKTNEKMNETKRWVVVGPHNPKNQPITDILLAKADDTNQIHQIGNQTGGRVGFFLSTNDFNASYEKMKLGGVDFLEEPRNEKHGIVAQFNDLYGNKWELIQKTGTKNQFFTKCRKNGKFATFSQFLKKFQVF
jgi:catechol 2,3-dioxygenase-like lactoylglutathione lyase family enzyme